MPQVAALASVVSPLHFEGVSSIVARIAAQVFGQSSALCSPMPPQEPETTGTTRGIERQIAVVPSVGPR